MDVHGSGWPDGDWRRGLWQPSTYRQVWIFAPLVYGVPCFCASAVFRVLVQPQRWLAHSLAFAVGMTLALGLWQSWQLHRRRRRDRHLTMVPAKAARGWRKQR